MSSDLTPVTRQEKYLASAAFGNPDPPAPVTREEKYLYAIAERANNLAEPVVVTLTPTALDYSGTMDKTVAEITEAWQAGKKIVFRLATDASTHIDVDVSLVGTDSDYDYPSFEGYVIQPNTNLFVWAGTDVTDDGTKDTYGTKIYALTPAT